MFSLCDTVVASLFWVGEWVRPRYNNWGRRRSGKMHNARETTRYRSKLLRLRSLCLSPRANTESRISIVSLPSEQDARESSWIILSQFYWGWTSKILGRTWDGGIRGNPPMPVHGHQWTFCKIGVVQLFFGADFLGEPYEPAGQTDSEMFGKKPFPNQNKPSALQTWQTGVKHLKEHPCPSQGNYIFFVGITCHDILLMATRISGKFSPPGMDITPGMGWPNSGVVARNCPATNDRRFFFRDSYNGICHKPYKQRDSSITP